MAEPCTQMPHGFSSPGVAVKFHKQLGEFTVECRRDWILEAAGPGSFIQEQYRKMEWDFEADVLATMGAFAVGGGYNLEDAGRDLRLIWRCLMGRYAFGAALKVGRQLWKNENSPSRRFLTLEMMDRISWRLWRGKDYLIWRLGIAVLVGFVLLASSSGCRTMIERIDGRWLAWHFVALELAVVYFLALAEVQRRIGRRRWWRVLLWRALWVTVAGALWSLPGSVLLQFIGWPGVPKGVLALCAATAVLMGFVFQLFWQDRSIGDPL